MMSDEIQNPEPPPQPEPSVLDYVKSLFRFGKGERIQLPDFVEDNSAVSGQPDLEVSEIQPSALSPQPLMTPFPWRSLLALGFALLGQKFLEPPPATIPFGIALYIMAFSMLGWAIYRGEWNLMPLTQTSESTDPLTYRLLPLLISLPLALWAFAIFTGNLFTTLNVFLWLAAVVLFIYAFWIKQTSTRSLFDGLGKFFQNGGLTFNISAWTLLFFAATVLVFFFRFTQTANVPPEPFSDHAEKILDVYDVSQGQTHIFFPRNTGREAIQMYWTLLVSKIFGTGLSYLSLKLGTAILGFLTLPFMYLLGKEIGGPRVGFFAFLLTGIGYWPNVISRIGLRFPLYPLFAAPTLLFLIRGLRTRNRNDFLLAGLFLGLGLHGYSPMRIVPLVVVAAFIIYWLHSQSQGARKDLPVWFAMLALVSLMIFLPLLRYWTEHPSEFGFRAMTRLTSQEAQITQPVPNIFASNVWKALKMYNFDDGEIWVNSLPHRPALDIVSGALFVIGFMLVLIRYIRKRHWLDLFLLISIPLLQLPSSLSLAFPGENPALNRAGGAYIPAFILSGLAFDGLLTSFGRGKLRSILIWGLAGILIYVSVMQNYDIVFNQFYNSFRQGAWNTSDMGKEIKQFQQTYGETDTVWVVPFPYWVDTRLPAVWAGIPNRDMAMWTDNISSTLELTGPKLFMVKANVDDPNANDQASLDVLKALYPTGQLRLFKSDISGHDFWIFFVPSN
ncbi:MAG: glycosyltransferase family 39 protein [Chloroflexota bacterium]